MTARPIVINAEPLGYSQRARAVLESCSEVVEGPFDRAGLLGAAAGADALIVRLGHRIDKDLFERSDRLRFVVSATTGLDHIDLQAAARSGVQVLSLRGERAFLETIRATVEHTFALLLTLLRRTHRAARHVEAGGWDRDRFRGRELAGRRLGIVGLGRIGNAVAELARAFHMEVAAFDPYRADWPQGVERPADLLGLCRQSDVLSLHVPLSNETRNMIGTRELDALPSGAFLVNTSRGGVLDEAALMQRLQSGRLEGAALDVLQAEEGGPPNHELLAWAAEHDNLVLTPHIGGATSESMERTEIFMAEKLRVALVTPSAREGR